MDAAGRGGGGGVEFGIRRGGGGCGGVEICNGGDVFGDGDDVGGGVGDGSVGGCLAAAAAADADLAANPCAPRTQDTPLASTLRLS